MPDMEQLMIPELKILVVSGSEAQLAERIEVRQNQRWQMTKWDCIIKA